MDPIEGVSQALGARATEFVREHRLPGVAAAIVQGDRLAWFGGAGFSDIASRRWPDSGTLYLIASITKTFTGTAIMQLRDAGALALDDPASDHLPELRGADARFGPIETVTIRRLLSHEAGLMNDPPGTEWDEPRYQGDAKVNLADAASIATMVPPNSQQKYSNLGYQLLGEIVSRVSGQPFDRYLTSRILEPLGMSSTGFRPLAPELDARRATGYGPRGFTDELAPAVEAPPSQAEGGLLSCVDDLARWIGFQLHPAGDERDGVLSAATLREMHRPRYLGDAAWEEAFGISWEAARRGDDVWIQHSGGLHGFTTNVCFDPRSGVGAIALFNGETSPGRLSMDLATIARDAVSAAPRPIEPPAPTPEAYRPLLGLYTATTHELVVRLEWRDGALTFIDAGYPDEQRVLREADGDDAFVIEPGNRESGEPVVFHRRADGHVHAVTVGPVRLARLERVEPS
jgi:CubicO group peptidase (beta-lactamase class C family)